MDKDVSCAFVFDSVVDVVMIDITIINSRTVIHSYPDVNDILVYKWIYQYRIFICLIIEKILYLLIQHTN